MFALIRAGGFSRWAVAGSGIQRADTNVQCRRLRGQRTLYPVDAVRGRVGVDDIVRDLSACRFRAVCVGAKFSSPKQDGERGRAGSERTGHMLQ